MSRWLVTGSSGHLGEALVRVLRARGDDVAGLDWRVGKTTTVRGSVDDRDLLARTMDGVDHVLHTATLHKPHIGSHSYRDFVDTNITGSLNVLQTAAAAGVRSVVLTSSTSAFGEALTPAPGEPAAWITEDVPHRVRNIYGATKTAAEDLGVLAAADGLPVTVLRTARFFPEADDRDDVRAAWSDANLKAVEFLHRRVDLADVVDAHLLAAEHTHPTGFRRYIISATTPFSEADRAELAADAAALIARRFPELAARFAARGWRLPAGIDRVYVNDRARRELGWEPRYDFRVAAELALVDGDPRSLLARRIGTKGYHSVSTGIYTTPSSTLLRTTDS